MGSKLQKRLVSLVKEHTAHGVSSPAVFAAAILVELREITVEDVVRAASAIDQGLDKTQKAVVHSEVALVLEAYLADGDSVDG